MDTELSSGSDTGDQEKECVERIKSNHEEWMESKAFIESCRYQIEE